MDVDSPKNNINKKTKTVLKSELIHQIVGLFLTLLSFLIFIIFTVWMILSKIIKFDEYKYNSEFAKMIIEFMINDKSYCMLFPSMLILSILVFYAKWIAYRYFKHC